jgi:hypothetical protein
MKLNTVLLGAIFALTVASASAAEPVYSVNVVGYHKAAIPANQFKMIANSLQGTNLALSAIMPAPPEGTAVFKFVGSGYSSAQFNDGAWEGAALTLGPGEGAFIKSPVAFTNIFAGEVILLSTNAVPSGYSIRSSVIPQAGLLQTELGFPVAEGDAVFRFNGISYVTSQFADGAWEGAGQPNVGVGESFFILNAGSSKNWVRNFSIP